MSDVDAIQSLYREIERLKARVHRLESGEYSALASLNANGDIKHVDGYVPSLRRLRHTWHIEYSSVEDFETTTPSGWSWAGSPFIAPPTFDIANGTVLQIRGYTTSNSRSFFYRSAQNLSLAFYGSALTTSAGSYVGIRVDDGTDNNYFEGVWQYDTSSPLGFRATLRQRTGGGTPVVTQSNHKHEIIPTTVGLAFSLNGSAWSNWREDLSLVSMGSTFAASGSHINWTASRIGIIINSGSATASWHRYFVDAIYWG